jgi:asparagine synthase (glutamine-hydrolysing)
VCGIAGTVDLRVDLTSAEDLVVRMTDALVHRGPDDAGMLVDAPVILGHRRLSILDLSERGRQPMVSASGRFWVVFNGEVYNYVELAAELRALGHEFQTTSDTEVLLAAFEEWGDDAPSRLNGEYAFALWDRERRELLCVRDRFGAKPFYYTVAGGRFRFASEIKALLIDPEVPRLPNDARVLEFLAYQLVDHTDETLFEGVKQLPPGCVMRVTEEGPAAPAPYYRPKPAQLNGHTPAEAVRERLTDSVRLRMRSDVPLGIALSGGLDSSSVMSLASKLLADEGAEPPICFTARCRDPKIDEGKWADYVVRATGARNVEVTPDDSELLHQLDTVLWHMDEPFHSPTVYGHWKVLELARQSGVTVVLEGQVGDEAFCGYSHLFPSILYSLLRRGRIKRAASEVLWRQRRTGFSVRTSLVQFAKFMLPKRLSRKRPPAWLARDAGVPRAPTPRRSIRHWHMHLLRVLPNPAFLHHDDRNSMSLGLESRTPFLDYNVVECGLACDADDLVYKGFGKWPVRQAMRGIVAPEILDRARKQGFSVDQRDWLTEGELGQVVEQTFGSAQMAARPYFDSGKLLETLAAHRAGRGNHAPELWRAFVVERWLRLFVDPVQVEAPPRHPSTPTSPVRASDHVVRLGAIEPAAV